MIDLSWLRKWFIGTDKPIGFQSPRVEDHSVAPETAVEHRRMDTAIVEASKPCCECQGKRKAKTCKCGCHSDKKAKK